MRIPVLGAIVMLLAAPSLSLAQAPPPPADTAPAARQDSRPRRAANPKRAECRQDGSAKGLRGPDLSNHIQICMLEARLACMKQAAERKIAGRDRRDFINTCQST